MCRCLALTLLMASIASAQTLVDPNLKVQTWVRGLNQPTGIAFVDNGATALVLEKTTGKVQIVRNRQITGTAHGLERRQRFRTRLARHRPGAGIRHELQLRLPLLHRFNGRRRPGVRQPRRALPLDGLKVSLRPQNPRPPRDAGTESQRRQDRLRSRQQALRHRRRSQSQ